MRPRVSRSSFQRILFLTAAVVVSCFLFHRNATSESLCTDCFLPHVDHPLATSIEFTGLVHVEDLSDFVWGVDKDYILYRVHLVRGGPAEIVSTQVLHRPAGNNRASGLGRDKVNNLWVTCDLNSGNIIFFDDSGNTVGGPSTFPGVMANGVAVGPDGSIWVVDTFDSMIYRRPPSGVWGAAFPSPEGTNLTGLAYIEIQDLLATLDLGTPPGASHRYLVMNLTGNCLLACDLEGAHPILRGLAVGPFLLARGSRTLSGVTAGAQAVKNPPIVIEDYDVSISGGGTPVAPTIWGVVKAMYR
jgi:hypothetical protein